MAVPNIFATATSAIPLSQLDQNFATAITRPTPRSTITPRVFLPLETPALLRPFL